MEINTYSSTILNDNPIAYWALDEIVGLTADNWGSIDSLLDATYIGSPQLGTAGLVDGSDAVLFDGIDDGVLLNSHSDLNTGIFGQKTIELWFKADDIDGTQVLYEQGGSDSGLNIYLNGGSLNMGVWSANSGNWLNTNISAGQTHHVTFVFDAGSLYGYLNGALIGTTSTEFNQISSHTDSGAIAKNASETRLSNSLVTTNSHHFAGTIDNVALYNSALSAEQVTAHYDARSQPIATGANALANSTAPTPTFATGSSGLVTSTAPAPTSETGSDASTNSTDLATPGPTDAADFSIMVPDVTFTGSAGDDVFVSGSGDDTLAGDRSQQGLNLDGANDYVEIANSTALHITNEITVETWINVDTFNRTWQAIVTKGDESWRLHRYQNSNVLNFALGNTGGRSVTGQTNVNDGQWHHVAATFDGDYVRLYVDGELDGELYSPGTIPQTSHRILLGENDQRTGRYFNGQLDDVKIWNVARTQAEIQASLENSVTTVETGIVTAGNAPAGIEAGLVGHWSFEEDSVAGNDITDLTGNGYQGTVVNGQDNHFVAETPGGNDKLVGGTGNDQITGGSGDDTLIGDENDQTLNLDGSNDYVGVAASSNLDLSTTSTFTLEAQLNSTATDNNFHGIVGYHPGSLEDRYPGMWVYRQTSIHFGFGDGVNWYHHTVDNVLTVGAWHHVAMTFDGTSFKLYVDAQEVFSTDAYAGKTLNTTQQIEIGKASGYYFEGQLDNVGVWNIARTDTEIQASMNGEVTGSESGLVGYWNFDKETVSGSEISDLSGNGNTGVVTNGQGDNFIASDVSGNDVLEGGIGDDDLWGNGGDDTLSGQAGNDTLTGGAGADRYVFESVADGIDVIRDFNAAEGDRIVLTESFGAETLNLMSFDGATGALSYDGVQFAILENVSSLELSTTIEAAFVNTAPIAVDDAFTTDEDTTLSGNLLADNGNGADSDPDGNHLTVQPQVQTTAASAQVTINADGSFAYDPNGPFDYLAAGETTTDSFTYTVEDEYGDTAEATATVQVSGVNDAPGLIHFQQTKTKMVLTV